MAKKKVDYNLLEEIPAEEIPEAYAKGLIGAYAEPDILARLLAESQTPLFGVAAYQLADTGKGKLSAPYKFALKCDPEFGGYEPQTTGSCVSHCTRNVGMVNYCYGVINKNKLYKGRLCTENIYGARNHAGQGASCSRLADYVVNKGGYLPRAKYTSPTGDIVDLSIFNERYGIGWGRSGTPDWLNKIASENKAESIALVKSLDEVRDAIANAYAVSCCSGFGFSSSKDENGVSEPRGSWSHAMAWIGFNDTEWAYEKYKGPLILIQNSWGKWNSGGSSNEQPTGSFWIRGSVAQRMLNSGGSFVISNVKGFPSRRLDYSLI